MKQCCLEFLMEQFGDREVVDEIYGEFVRSMDEKLDEADAALAAADWLKLDRVAHAVKGNALAAGDTAMADVAIELRGVAKLSEAEKAGELIAKMKELKKEL